MPAEWHEALTRRLRALLKSGPLHELRRNQGRLAAVLPHDDLIALTMRALEVLIDALGVRSGATRDEIVAALAPLADANDRLAGVVPDRARHQRLTEIVIGALLNDAGRRRAYEESYVSFVDGEARQQTLSFRIATEQETPSGQIVIRVEPDGVNLFLRSLDIDLEDAQAAVEAAMKSQLQRGRLDLARASAKEANIRSIQFRDKVQSILRRSQRDLGRVDWRREVPALLEEALAHIESRLEVERDIRTATQETLDRLPGNDETRLLREIAALLDECYQRHLALHQPLIGAYEVFRQEQARQRFAPLPLAPLPAPEREVLQPILGLGCAQALTVTDAFAFGATPAVAPKLLDLARLWDVLLKPPPRRGGLGPEPDQNGIAPYPEPPPKFDEELRQRIDARLKHLRMPMRLGAMLDETTDPREQHLLVLRVLQHFAPAVSALPIAVERAELPLKHARFAGDDLLVAPDGTDGR
jgi:hypothetical protein